MRGKYRQRWKNLRGDMRKDTNRERKKERKNWEETKILSYKDTKDGNF